MKELRKQGIIPLIKDGKPVGIASSGFPIPDLSGPEAMFPDSGNFNSRSGNREIGFSAFLQIKYKFFLAKNVKAWNFKIRKTIGYVYLIEKLQA